MSTIYETKHRAIVNAAIDVFLKQGFARTSMDKVAQAAGLSKVTLYNHFKDKNELFENVMVVHCERLLQSKKLIEFNVAISPKVQLKEFAHRFVTILLDKRSVNLMRLVIAEAGHFSEFGNALWPQGKMPLLEAFREYLIAEVKAGRLRIKDFDVAARQFAGLIKENLVWPVLMGLPRVVSEEERERVIDSAVTLFLAGYGVTASR